MENALVSNNAGRVETDSLRVAQKFGKEHKHVLDSIRELRSAENSAVLQMFYETNYISEQNKTMPMFTMNRDGFSLLVMRFTGKKALAFQIEFITAFNAMESEIAKMKEQLTNPFSSLNPDSLRMLADLKENEGRLQILTEQQQLSITKKDAVIEYLEPLATVGKALEFSEGSVTLGIFAPVIGFGQNTLFQQLRDDRILMSKGDRHNKPYSNYRHWFEVKPCKILSGPRAGKEYWQTRISPKGQAALIKKYKKKVFAEDGAAKL